MCFDGPVQGLDACQLHGVSPVFQQNFKGHLIEINLQLTWFPDPPRKGFLAAGVPVFLKGTGGPRAPHVFEFDRRSNLGSLDTNLCVKFFATPPPQVLSFQVLRCFGGRSLLCDL